MIDASKLKTVCPNCRDPELWAPLLNAAALKYAIDTPARMSAWLAQLAEESGEFNRLVENLNYSAEGLRKTWPRRFPPALAAECARNPERIAGVVYDGRMGNGPGDGWRYRGRGLAQITGEDNYRAAETATGLPLLAQPELLETPPIAAEVAGWFWRSRGLNALADAGRFDDIVRAWNGGYTGLDKRRAYWTAFKKVLQ